MEHLPIPEDCLTNVPPFEYYQAPFRYDSQGIAGFLDRFGSSEDKLAKDIIQNVSAGGRRIGSDQALLKAKELAGILQEWCWFGALHELEIHCGEPLDHSKLSKHIDTNPPTRTLCSDQLPEFVARVRAKDPHQFPKDLNTTALSGCFRWLERLTADLGSQSLGNALSFTLYAINIISEAIRDIFDQILHQKVYHPWRRPFPYSNLMCPSRMNYLHMVTSAGLYLITNSLPSFDARRHKKCSPTRCNLKLRASNPAEPEHVDDCNQANCKLVTVDEQRLIDILARGGNPGCRLDPTNPETLLLEDVTGGDYVAISHVWSHGLGNGLRNSLPWCQVSKLFSLVTQACGPSSALWIDTLSVPTSSEHKYLAITKLRQVYRDAKLVLVLDKYLQQVESDPFGRSLQLLASEWMTRLWTLQEAKLAQKLIVRFKNSSVHMHELLHPFAREEKYKDKSFFVNPEAIGGLLERLFTEQGDMTHRILWIAMSLCYRSVTVPTDEPICLATLLGLDLEQFAKSPSMADIYRAFPDDLPQDLVFFTGDRLAEPGLRWAPASLLRQPKIHIWRYEKARLTAQGFIVQKDYITFDSSPQDAPVQSQVIQTQAIIDDKPLAFSVKSQFLDHVPDLHKTALILHTPGNSRPGSSRALYVEMLRQEGNMMFCHFLAVAQTARGSRIDHANKALWGNSEVRMVQAKLHEDRLICID